MSTQGSPDGNSSIPFTRNIHLKAQTLFTTINKMENYINVHAVLSSVIFSLIGVLTLLLTFWAIEKVTPQNLWKEIVEKQNTALAIMAGAAILGMAYIIASAIHG